MHVIFCVMVPQSLIIDKITNSVEERVTGKSFPTIIDRAIISDIKGVRKKMAGSLTGKKSIKNLVVR